MPADQIPTFVSKAGPAKFAGGFIWGVRFQLPRPAAQDGWIIQRVQKNQSGFDAAGSAARSAHDYYEAWEVKRGNRAPETAYQQTFAAFVRSQVGSSPSGGRSQAVCHDFFFSTFSDGNSGTEIMRSSAGFYERSLPTEFRVGNRNTNAGGLPSTNSRPRFWHEIGQFRALQFDFDFRAGRQPALATLRTTTAPMGSVETSNPSLRTYRTHI